ncbi:hypothetical protein BS47DRAFT_920654 [Hydnum rufescens UP504]|uniref:Uncharacterized protein n=1 Tax=Hydnum rufescens UP504 TaxID=1448309 RepID=A0A9P6BC33_9AGAM|nr:hypothetical protein BS47DRAFT_920654 [Hydnum rufescens UP504]
MGGFSDDSISIMVITSWWLVYYHCIVVASLSITAVSLHCLALWRWPTLAFEFHIPPFCIGIKSCSHHATQSHRQLVAQMIEHYRSSRIVALSKLTLASQGSRALTHSQIPHPARHGSAMHSGPYHCGRLQRYRRPSEERITPHNPSLLP